MSSRSRLSCALVASGLFLASLPVGAQTASDSPTAAPDRPQSSASEPRPGLLKRAVGLLPFVGEDRSESDSGSGRSTRGEDLSLAVELDPAKVSLAVRRSVSVKATLRNVSRKAVVLNFRNGQRIEVLLRRVGGQVLERWSEDQAFSQELGTLVINPGERVEYEETLSLRNAKPGQPHTVEVFVVDRPDLSRTLPLEVTR